MTKLQNQLYPIITSQNNEPLRIISDLEEKLDLVLTDIKSGLTEINECIITTNNLQQRSLSAPQEIKTEPIKQKLTELQTNLTNISTEYEILTQMIINYFKNINELNQVIRNLKYNTQESPKPYLPNDSSAVEQLLSEHEGSKQAIQEMLRFTQNECDRLIERISKQEPNEECAGKDISRIVHSLKEERDKWEEMWTKHKFLLEQQHQLCVFNNDLHQINETIHDLSRQLKGVKGQYGESLAGAKATSLAFVYFEKTVQVSTIFIDNNIFYIIIVKLLGPHNIYHLSPFLFIVFG